MPLPPVSFEILSILNIITRQFRYNNIFITQRFRSYNRRKHNVARHTRKCLGGYQANKRIR